VVDACQGLRLFLSSPQEGQPDVGMAKVGRNQYFCDR